MFATVAGCRDQLIYNLALDPFAGRCVILSGSVNNSRRTPNSTSSSAVTSSSSGSILDEARYAISSILDESMRREFYLTLIKGASRDIEKAEL